MFRRGRRRGTVSKVPTSKDDTSVLRREEAEQTWSHVKTAERTAGALRLMVSE